MMEETTKLRNASKNKERRQPYGQTDGQQKRSNKLQSLNKSDITQLVPPQALGNNSPVNKVFNEANKIVRFGTEKEFALHEKDVNLQNSNETIDNLRKNIIHLQMEYEKLDQNYQRELSYRTEIMKRMEITSSIVESAVHYSNTLSASVKQLEDDKLKIAEFYEVIFQGQKEMEEKHLNLEKFIKERDNLFKAKIEDIKKAQEKNFSHNSETITQLNKNLSYANDKLKISSNENEKLLLKLQEFKENIKNLETSLTKKQNLNFSQQKVISKFKFVLKSLKFKKSKYQRLWKSIKKEFFVLKNKNKKLMNNFLTNESLFKESLSKINSLENENKEWSTKYTTDLELNSVKIRDWEYEKEDLLKKLTVKEQENEELKIDNTGLKEKLLELKKNEDNKKIEFEHFQKNSFNVIHENKKLKENIKELNEKHDQKSKTILELENKLSCYAKDWNLEVSFFKNESEKFEKRTKELESQILDLEKKLTSEKNEKEAIKSEFKNKLDDNIKVTTEKIINLEKMLEEKNKKIHEFNNIIKEKTETIWELQAEQSSNETESKKALENLKNELHIKELNNEGLNLTVEKLKQSNEDVNNKLHQAQNQILNLEEKLKEEMSTSKTLKTFNDEFEKTVRDLKKELEQEKKLSDLFKQKHSNAENELNKLQKIAKENSELNTTIVDLKNLLTGTEAKVEAYKVVIKKLESEMAENKDSNSEEIFKLKSELNRMEEILKKDKDLVKPQVQTPQKNTKSQPFLSTPRKVVTSTPQLTSGFRSLTPFKKKRDPYEFDSDSSAERFDPDQVLKVFHNRQKKEPNKKSKTNK